MWLNNILESIQRYWYTAKGEQTKGALTTLYGLKVIFNFGIFGTEQFFYEAVHAGTYMCRQAQCVKDVILYRRLYF